jgi:thioredoxin 1
LLRQLRIYGIPTLVSFKDGQEVARQTGVAPYPVLAGLFEAAISGEKPQPISVPMTWIDRFLRIAIAAALLYLAYLGDFKGVYPLFVGLSGLAFFSAVHDRCPIWQALKPRLTALLKLDRSQE